MRVQDRRTVWGGHMAVAPVCYRRRLPADPASGRIRPIPPARAAFSRHIPPSSAKASAPAGDGGGHRKGCGHPKSPAGEDSIPPPPALVPHRDRGNGTGCDHSQAAGSCGQTFAFRTKPGTIAAGRADPDPPGSRFFRFPDSACEMWIDPARTLPTISSSSKER